MKMWKWKWRQTSNEKMTNSKQTNNENVICNSIRKEKKKCVKVTNNESNQWKVMMQSMKT